MLTCNNLNMKTSNFEIITGTYEEYLLGYYFLAKQSSLVQSFASHDHSSSIRSAAISGPYLASGAADDRIVVYDLKSRKEHCMLTHHEATVTCLQFTHNHSHLISGSADGVLAIVRVGNWQLEKMWKKAHKGFAILDIAVHSSGKLALTLGADCSLRTWNLVKGRQAFIINLNSKSKDARSLNKITWAEDGVRFILSGGKYTEIWSLETGGIQNVIEHDQKVSSCIWLSDDCLLIGYENGQISAIKLDSLITSMETTVTGRVKALAKYKNWIVSATSSGEIKVWDGNLKELASYDSGCRITCLGIVPPIRVKKEEEMQEIVEPVIEQTVSNSVKKRTVVVEIEGSDDEERDIQTTKKKQKLNTVKNQKQKTDINQNTGYITKKKKKNNRNNDVKEIQIVEVKIEQKLKFEAAETRKKKGKQK